MQWHDGKWDGDRTEEGEAEARHSFKSHTASSIPSLGPSTPLIDPIIQDWIIYEDHFSNPPPLALNAIDDKSDQVLQSLADDDSEWKAELRQRLPPENMFTRLNELPKHLYFPEQLTPLTLGEANSHKAWLIQQISKCPQLSYDKSKLNRSIVLDFSRQFIPTSKKIEDEYQHLRYQIYAQKPTAKNRICVIFAFREMVLFNTVKCWVWMNVHMLGHG